MVEAKVYFFLKSVLGGWLGVLCLVKSSLRTGMGDSPAVLNTYFPSLPVASLFLAGGREGKTSPEFL